MRLQPILLCWLCWDFIGVVRGQDQPLLAVTQLGPEIPVGMWVGELVFPLQALYGPARPDADCCFLSQTIARENPRNRFRSREMQFSSVLAIRSTGGSRMHRAHARAGSCPIIFPSLGGSGDARHRHAWGDASPPHCHQAISPVSTVSKSPALSR